MTAPSRAECLRLADGARKQARHAWDLYESRFRMWNSFAKLHGETDGQTLMAGHFAEISRKTGEFWNMVAAEYQRAADASPRVPEPSDG